MDPRTGNTTVSRHLRLLLLSASDVADAKLADTILRLQHFVSLTGGQDLAIVFLLSRPAESSFVSSKALASSTSNTNDGVDGVYAYAKLQAELANHDEILTIPILPLATLSDLANLLKKHAEALTRSSPRPAQRTASIDLLGQCTSNPPMPQETVFYLSDIFPNLAELASACTTVTSAPNSSSPSARAAAWQSQDSAVYDLGLGMSTQSSESGGRVRRLRDLVGREKMGEIVDFWAEEWTAD